MKKRKRTTRKSIQAVQGKIGKSILKRVDPETNKRLRELILYIARCCENDPTFGATKLNKILYYADFLSYGEYGESITGAQYMKLSQGPVPVQLIPVREKMVKDHDIVLRKEPFYEQVQHRIIPLREPDLSLFKARDIAWVDKVIAAFSGHTARDLSNLSHNHVWRIARDGEVIPYQAILLDETEVTTTDMAEAKKLIKKHGWKNV
jgi:hypothetical protein